MFSPSISPDSQAVAHSTAHGLVVLSVMAGGEMFAIDVRNVREIYAWTPSVSLPGAPTYVEGVLNVWGDVVPLVVLALRLGLPDTRPPAPVTVIVERGDDVIGLVVDRVCDLHSISVDQLNGAPAIGAGDSARLLRGVITLDAALMCLIDVEEMLPVAAVPAAGGGMAREPGFIAPGATSAESINEEVNRAARF